MRAFEPSIRKSARTSTSNTKQTSVVHTTTSTTRHPTGRTPLFLDKVTKHVNMTPKTPYVLQGLYYFLRHKVLWKTMACPILWSIVFAIAAFCILLPLVSYYVYETRYLYLVLIAHLFIYLCLWCIRLLSHKPLPCRQS